MNKKNLADLSKKEETPFLDKNKVIASVISHFKPSENYGVKLVSNEDYLQVGKFRVLYNYDNDFKAYYLTIKKIDKPMTTSTIFYNWYFVLSELSRKFAEISCLEDNTTRWYLLGGGEKEKYGKLIDRYSNSKNIKVS